MRAFGLVLGLFLASTAVAEGTLEANLDRLVAGYSNSDARITAQRDLKGILSSDPSAAERGHQALIDDITAAHATSDFETLLTLASVGVWVADVSQSPQNELVMLAYRGGAEIDSGLSLAASATGLLLTEKAKSLSPPDLLSQGIGHNLAGEAAELDGRYRDALPHRLESVRIGEAHFAPDAQDLLVWKLNLASLHVTLGRQDEGFVLYDDVGAKIAADPDAYGLDFRSGYYASHGRALTGADQIDKAIRLLRQAVDIDLDQYGPLHAYTAISRDNLAAALQADEQFEAALIEARAAWEAAQASFGPDHPHTQYIAVNLAMIAHDAGDLDTFEEIACETDGMRELPLVERLLFGQLCD